LPMPLAAPVTMQTLSFSFMVASDQWGFEDADHRREAAAARAGRNGCQGSVSTGRRRL
jgi:hypothetical protein